MARKVMFVVDIDDDEGFATEAIEIQALHKSGAWMKLIEVKAGDFGFGPDLEFYHRVFRVVKTGQSSRQEGSEG